MVRVWLTFGCWSEIDSTMDSHLERCADEIYNKKGSPLLKHTPAPQDAKELSMTGWKVSNNRKYIPVPSAAD